MCVSWLLNIQDQGRNMAVLVIVLIFRFMNAILKSRIFNGECDFFITGYGF